MSALKPRVQNSVETNSAKPHKSRMNSEEVDNKIRLNESKSRLAREKVITRFLKYALWIVIIVGLVGLAIVVRVGFFPGKLLIYERALISVTGIGLVSLAVSVIYGIKNGSKREGLNITENVLSTIKEIVSRIDEDNDENKNPAAQEQQDTVE